MNRRSVMAALGVIVATLVLPEIAEAKTHRRRSRGRGPHHAYYDQLGRSSLAEENIAADQYGMARLDTMADLQTAIDNHTLWPLKETEWYRLDDSFAEYDRDDIAKYAHARRQVLDLLEAVCKEGMELHRAALTAADGTVTKFQITSMTRTKDYQKRVKRWNRYAADGKDPNRRSTHMTGSTVDISTGTLPQVVRDWLRTRLAGLERLGYVLARQEGHGCLHIFVRPIFTPDLYAALASNIDAQEAARLLAIEERRTRKVGSNLPVMAEE